MFNMEEKTAQMWNRFWQTRQLEARNELVLHYVNLVKYIVYRMLPTYRKHVETDDLMSCGLLGLMDAIDKFDPGKEVKFETYATLRIKGEIIDQIRKQDWAPISLRKKIKKVEEGFATLESLLGRSATEAEVAGHIDMPVDDVKKVLDDSYTFNLISIDEMLIERLTGEDKIISREITPEEKFENEEIKQVLAKSIDRLSDRERLVISLYYFEELTLKEIGLMLGVSESRVSQIHSKALLSLKNIMNRAYALR